MSLSISQVILNNLVRNAEFVKRAAPYLKEEYFEEDSEKAVFRHINEFIAKYSVPPTFDAVFVSLAKDKTIGEETEKKVDDLIVRLQASSDTPDITWLITESEAFCKERAIYNAIMESIHIFEGKKKGTDWGTIPTLLTDALSVSFDTSIGHDYLEDAEIRFDHYHDVVEKFPFDIDAFNVATGNGVGRKTLNVIVAGPHAGKTAMLCHLSAMYLRDGKNVLYVTNEMSEIEIAKRIDSNLFDVNISDVTSIPKGQFDNEVARLKQKYTGKLKIKEYPTSTCHVGHIRSLLNELKIKQNFEPDVIMVDYLNILTSFRIKFGQQVNMYQFIKTVSEELRGLAVEQDLPIWTATQLNKQGYMSDNPGMESISESFGVNFTSDFEFTMIVNDDLINKGMVFIKQLKNRYQNMNDYPKFMIGFDRSRMRFVDLGARATDDLPEPDKKEKKKPDKPVMDSTPFGSQTEVLRQLDFTA